MKLYGISVYLFVNLKIAYYPKIPCYRTIKICFHLPDPNGIEFQIDTVTPWLVFIYCDKYLYEDQKDYLQNW